MTENTAFYLECESKDRNLGMTTLSGRLQDLVRAYSEWLNRNELEPEDVAYAKIYRTLDFGCIGQLIYEGEQWVLQPKRVWEGFLGTQLRRAKFHLKYWWRSIWWAIRFRDVELTELHSDEQSEKEGEETDHE